MKSLEEKIKYINKIATDNKDSFTVDFNFNEKNELNSVSFVSEGEVYYRLYKDGDFFIFNKGQFETNIRFLRLLVKSHELMNN